MSQEYVRKLEPGDSFRDWLVKELGHRIRNKNCKIREFRVRPASHKVCRYEFDGEGFSVIAKFLAKPTGKIKSYDARKAMLNEYYKLRKLERIIEIPRPIAVNSHFDCVLVTEYIPGTPFSRHLRNGEDLDEKLKAIARMLRRLHKNTRNHYEKDREFEKIRRSLARMPLRESTRKRYERRLEKWQKSPLLDINQGCMVHHDATPANYLFHRGRPYAIDFELATKHGHCAHDLGILSAEVFHHFAKKGEADASIPHIKRFLRSYSRDENEYRRIKQVLPLYMSYGLLRVAWRSKDLKHREYLIYKAVELVGKPGL
ncbi:aminoglycoside phosphotransferase family protein [Methanosarcina sp. KYL-1]|nr:aminoglycoside phosphotransferase family protein [Methanosarcina sp. KYL-1]